MKTTFLSIIVFFISLTQVHAQTYTIDSGHSSVQIRVERFGVVDVVGRFEDVQGSITFNDQDITKTTANALIQVNSYDANNKGGEDAVKSPAFLDVANYPEINFIGRQVIEKEGKHYLVGELTIHGATNAIELPFTVKGPLLDLPTQKQSIAFNAAITINRQDYDVKFDRKLPNGTPLVSNDIRITVTVLAIAE